MTRPDSYLSVTLLSAGGWSSSEGSPIAPRRRPHRTRSQSHGPLRDLGLGPSARCESSRRPARLRQPNSGSCSHGCTQGAERTRTGSIARDGAMQAEPRSPAPYAHLVNGYTDGGRSCRAPSASTGNSGNSRARSPAQPAQSRSWLPIFQAGAHRWPALITRG